MIKLISDRIYRINKIKATLIHPEYPVNLVKIKSLLLLRENL
jgi:hypothetical protein